MASLTITQSEIQDPETEIRALCWKNPFGVAMLAGKTETRTKKTNVRGLVLIVTTASQYKYNELLNICGGKKLHLLMLDDISSAGYGRLLGKDGYAIGIGRLVNSRPMEEADENKTFVKFENGFRRHCWEFADVVPIQPFKLKGFQGWRILSPEVVSKIQIITINDCLR